MKISYAAPIFFPPDPGLTPRAHSNAAAARPVPTQVDHVIPPRNSICGCDTVSKASLDIQLSARLKSCPDTKQLPMQAFPPATAGEAVPDTKPSETIADQAKLPHHVE